jgi:hypothetical protein
MYQSWTFGTQQKGEKTASDLQLKYKNGDFGNTDIKVTTGNEIKTKTKFDKLYKNLVLTVEYVAHCMFVCCCSSTMLLIV